MAGQWARLRMDRAQLVFLTVCVVLQPFLHLTGMPGAYCAQEGSENLLKNSGFEDGTDGQPHQWRCFVAPADGAEAAWDETVHRSGKRSAMLHVETPYSDEVYNNWYQHVPVIPVAKQLVLSGYIRSEDVTDAAIWLQCWRESSQEVLRFATTSVGHPISGTAEWTHVEASIVPPPETAFLTVRCVIAGKGTAWFDDLQLVSEQQRTKSPRPRKTGDRPKSIDQEAFKELMEAHKTLLEVNSELAENARLLMEEIAGLREELNELKRSLETLHAERNENADNVPPARGVPFRPAARKRSTTSESELPP